MRTFVMGDIHGAFRALIQCLERSGFDYENDQLIPLGDIVDGYPQVYECVEELLKIKHLTALKGNHDDWFDEFIKSDLHPYFWNHGGKGTLISYLEHAGKSGRFFAKGSGYKTALESRDIPERHKLFFSGLKPYHIDQHNRCFIHAGFNRKLPFHEQKTTDYYWDRNLWRQALEHAENGEPFTMMTVFKEIYIGHTQTTHWETDQPLRAFNIHNLDTGAGGAGRLTIMDVETKAYWQSDLTSDLYPGDLMENQKTYSHS
ncbi:metallophosphoesterase [Mucilaginibacter sp. McL0603]|uniref:metallophosphoesterase n=1 Tax=Mucilaginibacter sp. McL0603 TaxID=3415670 RepID=UPI003CFBAC58